MAMHDCKARRAGEAAGFLRMQGFTQDEAEDGLLRTAAWDAPRAMITSGLASRKPSSSPCLPINYNLDMVLRTASFRGEICESDARSEASDLPSRVMLGGGKNLGLAIWKCPYR